MRIAVIQHQLRPAPAQDLEALVLAARAATVAGAELIVLPRVPALYEGPLGDELWRRLADEVPNVAVLAPQGDVGAGAVVDDIERLGRTAMLPGDIAFDRDLLACVLGETPEVLIMAPEAESELQAQAVLELAVGLSTSLASLVIVVACEGAGFGEPGHGGSAVVHLGQVVAEAMSGDDTLMVEVETPPGQPEPRGVLPDIPPVLAQRLAAHAGRKLAVDYPADLS